MLKIITFCIIFFSGSIFANNCSEHASKNLMTLEGKVANVGPDHSMEVVIKTGEKSYYLRFENRETKKFFQQSNYKRFEVTGLMGDQKEWPPSFIVKEYKLLD